LTEPLLSVEGLSTGYGYREVLHDIDLAVGAGEVLLVIGPNGHGKSTLLRCLSGLTRPWRGRIRFSGTDTTNSAPNRIVGLGLGHVPQGDMLFTDMSVRENLLMGGYLAGAGPATQRRLDAVLTLMPRLGERMNQRAGTLSGGERRMVAIGRGLVGDSRLLMIDEPSLGLAPILIDQIYVTLAAIRAEGMAILLVEENAARGGAIADRTVLVENGGIVWRGDATAADAETRLLETYLGV